MNKKFLLAIATSTLMFAACGDDVTEVTEVNEIHQEGIAVLDAGLELSKQKCGAENAGEMLFVTDSAMVFVCDGGTWVSLKGADGKPGEDGDAGDDGESCTAKPVKNEAGVEGLEVTCGKTVVGTIWNGTNGAGCTLDDDGKGSVTVTCGEDDPVILYKAMCATEPYDPKTQFCDTRDGQVYKIVTIGAQTWMAQNLNYEVNDGSQSWCYGDDPANCRKYGRLYTWEAAMSTCPSGWHLPSDGEWKILWSAVGGEDVAGMGLKSTSGWDSGGNGTDASGFSVLPAGRRRYDGDFRSEGNGAYFWSASEDTGGYAYYWYFDYLYDNVSRYYSDKIYGFSVRCLRDSN